MKKEGKDLEVVRCLKGRDGLLSFIEDRAKIQKKHIEMIMKRTNGGN